MQRQVAVYHLGTQHTLVTAPAALRPHLNCWHLDGALRCGVAMQAPGKFPCLWGPDSNYRGSKRDPHPVTLVK
jgi:hypothetical protein